MVVSGGLMLPSVTTIGVPSQPWTGTREGLPLQCCFIVHSDPLHHRDLTLFLTHRHPPHWPPLPPTHSNIKMDFLTREYLGHDVMNQQHRDVLFTVLGGSQNNTLASAHVR